jgi:hypothetical protein
MPQRYRDAWLVRDGVICFLGSTGIPASAPSGYVRRAKNEETKDRDVGFLGLGDRRRVSTLAQALRFSG